MTMVSVVGVLAVAVTLIVLAKKRIDQSPVHKDLQSCFNCTTALQKALGCLERHFPDANRGFQKNRGWIMRHVPCTLGFELGVYFNDAEMVERFSKPEIRKEKAIFELCSYCDRPDVRKALEMLGPSDSDNGYLFGLCYAGMLFSKRDKELLMFVQGLLPKINVSDPNRIYRGIHTDYSFGCSNSYWTLLSKAVDDNDVEMVTFLLDLGADPNVYLHSFWNRNKDSPSVIREPVIEHIKSQEVFNVMAKAGMNLYPQRGSDEEIKNGKGEEVFLSEQQRTWRCDWESRKFPHV